MSELFPVIGFITVGYLILRTFQYKFIETRALNELVELITKYHFHHPAVANAREHYHDLKW